MAMETQANTRGRGWFVVTGAGEEWATATRAEARIAAKAHSLTHPDTCVTVAYNDAAGVGTVLTRYTNGKATTVARNAFLVGGR